MPVDSESSASSALDRGVAAVLADFPDVAAAWIFGSEARGTARPDSDLDVGLVLRDRTKTALDIYRDLAAIAARTERLIPGRRVDVVLLEPQGPVFRHAALRDGRLVYDAAPERRIDFESDTYVRYFDYLPTYQIAARRAVQGVRDWLEQRR